MQLAVLDTQGTQVGTLDVSDSLFAVPMNSSVVHQAVLWQLANARQGTSSTKTRAMVSGGGIKPRPQKGSGRSRQGSTRAPQWRHGGVVFGPHPRSYHQRLPRKMRRLAIRCLLSDKALEGRLTVIQSLDLTQPKTREMKQVLEVLKATSSTLLVTPQKDEKVVMAAANLEKVKALPATNVNVLDLLNHDRLVITVDAVRVLEEMWSAKETSAEEGAQAQQ